MVVVWGDLPPKKTLSQDYNFFIILYYFFTTRYFTHYEDNIYNSYTTESCLLKKTNQKKGNSISDLLIMARPECVAFGLSLASSSSDLMNARMRSLESSCPPESMSSLSYSTLSLSSVSLLSALALLSFGVNFLAFLNVRWPALRGLFCCKHECLTISLTLSLLLFFKCCFSRWSLSTCLVLEHVAF